MFMRERQTVAVNVPPPVTVSLAGRAGAALRVRTHDRAWLCVLGVALAVRLVIFAGSAGADLRIADEQHYATLAANLHQGKGFSQWGQPTSMRPPLYPAMIAGIWALTGAGRFDAVRLAQLVFGLVSVWAVHATARRLYDQRTALGAALVTALYPTLVVSGVLVLTEVVFTTLLLLFVLGVVSLLSRSTPALALATGIALGLAALTRSVMWPFVVVTAAFLLAAAPGSFRRRAAAAALLTCGYLVIVGPWAWRNTRLQGTVTVIDTMGGLNLLMGNYEHTPENRMWAAAELTGTSVGWNRDLPLHDDDGADWTEGRKEKWAQRQALAYIAAHPATTLRRSLLKFADFWGLEREFLAGVARGMFPLPRMAAVGAAAVITVSWMGVAALAAVGLVLVPPTDRRSHAFILLVVLFVCGVHSVVFAHSRYHLPLVPLLGIYAAAAVRSRGWRRFRPVRGGAVAAMALLLMLGLIWGHEVFVRDRTQVEGFIEAVR
jgi:4-amino-4-deoxy-L-arabinose transferase-like glycosyltransferase